MTILTTLPVDQQGALDAIRRFLARLLESNVVDAVLVPLETHDRRSVQPALVRNSERLVAANPLMPVLPLSAARMASLLTERCPENGTPHEHPFRVAVVMRPCELRATIELAKLNQVQLDQILTVGIDCPGTYETPDYQNAAEDPDAWLAKVLGAAREGNPDSPHDLPYRPACEICDTPVPWNANIAVHTIGVDTGQHILVAIDDEALVEPLGLEPLSESGTDAARRQVVEALQSARAERRQTALDEMAAALVPQEDGTPGLLALFETCQRCHNCTTACPICYCKQCLFRTRTFEHESRRYFGWAARKGAARLPGDTVAFQLTRLSHVTTSCVGCGLCTSACPADLPVDRLFQTVAREVQALFDYVPGRDPEETLPTTTFREDEFVTLGKRERG